MLKLSQLILCLPLHLFHVQDPVGLDDVARLEQLTGFSHAFRIPLTGLPSEAQSDIVKVGLVFLKFLSQLLTLRPHGHQLVFQVLIVRVGLVACPCGGHLIVKFQQFTLKTPVLLVQRRKGNVVETDELLVGDQHFSPFDADEPVLLVLKAVLAGLELKDEVKVHGIHVLELAEEMAVGGHEVGLEIPERFCQVVCWLLEEDIEVARIVAVLQSLVGSA